MKLPVLKYSNKIFSLAEPLNRDKQTLKEYRVVYLLDGSGKVKDKKINARTSSEALMRVKLELGNKNTLHKINHGLPKMMKAFELPKEETVCQNYIDRLNNLANTNKNVT
jgi:hypothetical protein